MSQSQNQDNPVLSGDVPAAETGGAPLEALLSDVPLELSVELGRSKLSLREVVERLGPGSVISLTKLTGEKLDVLINNRLVARGEAVAVGDRYGIRITEIVGAKKEEK